MEYAYCPDLTRACAPLILPSSPDDRRLVILGRQTEDLGMGQASAGRSLDCLKKVLL